MNKKSKLKEVGEVVRKGIVPYSVGKLAEGAKKIARTVRIKACEKKGGVWSKGECIPKSKIRKGKGKAVDWYPEKSDLLGPTQQRIKSDRLLKKSIERQYPKLRKVVVKKGRKKK